MFNNSKDQKKDVRENIIETVIGEMTKIEGNFVSDSGVELKGTVDGDVEVNGCLVVGDTAKLKAKVRAEEILVKGEIIGNLKIDGNVTIASTGKVVGDIASGGNFIIEPGAIFVGSSQMDNKENEDLSDVDISDDGLDDVELD